MQEVLHLFIFFKLTTLGLSPHLPGLMDNSLLGDVGAIPFLEESRSHVVSMMPGKQGKSLPPPGPVVAPYVLMSKNQQPLMVWKLHLRALCGHRILCLGSKP